MTRIRLILLPAFLFTFAVSSAYAAQCEPNKVAEKYPDYAGKIVKIAASPSQPPFAFSDPENMQQMSGLEAEMIEKAMSCAGLKFEYFKGAWSALLPALYSGSADVMIGAVNYRPERAARADFILYMRAGQSIIVLRDNPKNLTSMDSLCGHTGSSNANGSPAQSIQSQSKICTEHGKPAINFLPAVDTDAAYRQLINGRVDFVMDDAPAAAARIKKQTELMVAHTVTTDILSGMVVTKGNKEMLRVVADGLRAQQQDGTLANLMKKYGMPPETIIPIETRE
jgi:polar amino acid transport system substrate-binding protein